MRLLALVSDAFGGSGGIARYNRDFFSALSSQAEVSVVVLPRRIKTQVDRMPPRVIQKKNPSGKVSYLFSAFQILQREGPFDLIFSGHLHLAPLAALLARWAKLPFWLQLHGVEAWERPTPILHWAVKQVALITAVSRYTRQKFLALFDVAPEKVKVLPNTVGERFQPGPKPDYLLRRYGLTGKKVLLTLGRLSSKERYKGQDRIISLLPQLLEKHPNLVYVIAGEGDDRPRLEAMAERERVAGAVRFLGPVPDVELVDHYRLADLFVMPSSGEGFGIAFLEAAACGISVVGGNRDGSLDALFEGKLGRGVDPEDPQALAWAIEETLDSRKIPPGGVERFSNENFSHLVQELAKRGFHHVGDTN